MAHGPWIGPRLDYAGAMARWLLTLGVLAALATNAGPAHATAAPRPPPVLVQGLRLSEGVLVSRADTDVSCVAGPHDAPRCTVRITYALVNQGAEPREGGGSLVVDDSAQDLRLTLDGVATSASTTTVVEGKPQGQAPTTFALSIGAHATRALTVSAVFDGARTTGRLGFTPSAVHARHLVLHTPSVRRILDVLIAAPPTELRAPGFASEARLRTPRGWDLDGLEGWTEAADGSHTASVAELRIGVHIPPFPIRNGGVLLGLGGALGDDGGFRMRLGWEVAAPSWLLYQVSAETDARGRWNVTPLVLAASNALLIIPSFGFGVGMPIQVRPDTRLGVRIQLEAQLLPIGFVASCDLWPKTSTAPAYTQWTLLGQIAL